MASGSIDTVRERRIRSLEKVHSQDRVHPASQIHKKGRVSFLSIPTAISYSSGKVQDILCKKVYYLECG